MREWASRREGEKDFLAHSDYMAVTDFTLCRNCGTCVKRCVFDVRKIQDKKLVLKESSCYGCGLCVTTCPEKAISMQVLSRRQVSV
jgi:heterodisulfide reductase subunit A-like polyferredoxin